MTFKFPDFKKKEDIFELNPVLKNVKQFQGMDSDEMCFVMLMADAMSPFRFAKSGDEKIDAILDIMPHVKTGVKRSLQSKFRNYKAYYKDAINTYIDKFSSKSDIRALKGREALINTYEQYCELYMTLDLANENMTKMDKETLDNIKQISTMVKQGTITDLAEQIEKIEARLSFTTEIKGKAEFTGDPEDMIQDL